jgi:hypothetical protein
MAQLATTFVQYARELGRSLETPSSLAPRDWFSPTSTLVRRVETVDDPLLAGFEPPLGTDKIYILVRAMAINHI